MEKDELSFLKEELVQLSMKSSKICPTDKFTLLCSVWTKKSFNPNRLRAQLKSLWKTKKKFDIKVTGPNLFLILFDSEDDLEMTMAGRPWLFHRHLILFERLLEPIERKKIHLV